MSKEVVPVGVLISTEPTVAPELPPAVSPDVVVVQSGEPEDEDPVPELVEPKVPVVLTCAVPVVTMTLPVLEAEPPVVPLPDTVVEAMALLETAPPVVPLQDTDTAITLSRSGNTVTLSRSGNTVNFLCPFRPGVCEADCVNPIQVKYRCVGYRVTRRENKSTKGG
jgi:hypothetical protein